MPLLKRLKETLFCFVFFRCISTAPKTVTQHHFVGLFFSWSSVLASV